ncbi:epimerase [Paucibacter aquatile]|uniref:Epimerase n=1 Tax=Kinneretia aquatilis TaxID=2070761 RepID=A0A2N8L0R5_9BURK|nr:NAD-dependent epimerase/dehydratase family protein [Paucibacter aquatile]PND39309.1 epimerase [Paucibacter aquatile]
MKLLILGGTQFLGRHMAEQALAAGHEVTLFNRGSQGRRLMAGVEQLQGDRRGDLSILRGRRWDAVLDPSCYLPSAAQRSAELLREACEHYTLISTISVYPQIDADTDETSPVAELSAEALAQAETQATAGASQSGGGYGAAYGGLKVLCERAVQAVMGERALILRPGFIVGPYDYSPRLPYWLLRLLDAAEDGAPVLAPGRPERPVRLIDARDIARFALQQAEAGQGGLFNTTGADGLSMGALLTAARSACGSRAELCWRPEAELLAAGVQPFADLPYWLPEADNAMMEMRNPRAEAAGLRFTPLAQTLADTVAWLRAGPRSASPCLSREREQALLPAGECQPERAHIAQVNP